MTPRAAKRWLPWLVLLLGAGSALGLVAVRPQAPHEAIAPRPPYVPVVPFDPARVTVEIDSQGTVEPGVEIDVVAETSGRVIAASPALVSGGFFEAGELLVALDPRDHELAVTRARAARDRAASERALAHSTLERQQQLARRDAASPAALEQVRTRDRMADAALRDAEAALAQARRDLERTRVHAPFAGRVREKRVGIGHFVRRGEPIARIYSVEYAEVRLPLADRDAAFLDLPGLEAPARGGAAAAAVGPPVELRARFAGRESRWHGRIVRTEGEIDPRTRMLHAIARVDDPYHRTRREAAGDDARAAERAAPLAVGLFVQARITGRPLDGVHRVARERLRGERLAVIDASDRVRLRHVELVRTQGRDALVRGGIAPGDRLPLAPLRTLFEGARVRTREEAPATPGATAALDPRP